MKASSTIEIYEVGPRDGLQSAKCDVSVADKVSMIEQLYDCGIRNIEVGSFVHPKLVPNMSASATVYKKVKKLPCHLSVLVPNEKGLERAKAVGATNINVCLSPSETFNAENFNSSLAVLHATYRSMLWGIPKENIRVYISHAFGCPTDGQYDDLFIANVLQQSALLGYTVVLSDTAGIADAQSIQRIGDIIAHMPSTKWAVHLHENEHGDSLIGNVQMAYDIGIRQFDTSIGGIGGCPFVKGSGANLATETLLQWANDNDIGTVNPIDASKLTTLGQWVQGLISKSHAL
jgi:hydroxymethylglutaryl-CoA lyase